MSQRDSGYERKERDCYETPEWVTEALLPHLPIQYDGNIWEPACGSGKMTAVLRQKSAVFGTDIITGNDFLDSLYQDSYVQNNRIMAIVTNPPYENADKFIQRAIDLMQLKNGTVAMLLRTDFDHAKSRLSFFRHRAFAKKLVLTRRIRWFEDSKGSPSFNHAWFIWDWKHEGPPTIAYA